MRLDPNSIPIRSIARRLSRQIPGTRPGSRPLLLPLLAAAVALAVHSFGAAAGADTGTHSAPAPAADRTDTANTAETARSADTTLRIGSTDRRNDSAVNESRRDVRLSRLLDRDVRNPQGRDLGDIEDIVIDVRDHQILYVVIEYGGLLGIGDKLFAFPLQAFSGFGTGKPGTAARARAAGESEPRRDEVDAQSVLPRATSMWRGDGDLVLNVDQQQLDNAPGFAEELWPDFNDAGYREQVDRYWRPESGANKSVSAHRQAPWPLTWRASEMLGAKVVGEMGRDIGEISDVVVDVQSGKLQYAVVAFDQGWFEKDKLVAVPAGNLTPQGEGRVSLDAEKNQIAKAPAFDRDRWPDLNDPAYRSGIERYVGEWGYPGPNIKRGD